MYTDPSGHWINSQNGHSQHEFLTNDSPSLPIKFDRTKAAEWAEENISARECQAGVDCASFVSQSLYQGGLPADNIWYDGAGCPSEERAVNVEALYNYLVKKYGFFSIDLVGTFGSPLSNSAEFQSIMAQIGSEIPVGSVIIYRTHTNKSDDYFEHAAITVGNGRNGNGIVVPTIVEHTGPDIDLPRLIDSSDSTRIIMVSIIIVGTYSFSFSDFKSYSHGGMIIK